MILNLVVKLLNLESEIFFRFVSIGDLAPGIVWCFDAREAPAANIYSLILFRASLSNKSKGIYGNASKKDLMELKEEGIDAQMIPWLEDKDN